MDSEGFVPQMNRFSVFTMSRCSLWPGITAVRPPWFIWQYMPVLS